MIAGSSVRFLARYFRPYLATAVLTVLATALYTLATLVVVALLEPIFSDVMLMSPPAAGTSSVGSVVGADLPAPAHDLDPRRWVNATFERLRSAWHLNQADEVLLLPILFALAIIGRSLAGFANGYWFQVMGLGATNDLRNDLFRRILDRSSRFFTRHPSGELASRVGSDIAVIQSAVSIRLLDLFQQSTTLLAVLGWMFFTQFRLAAFSMLVAPVVALAIASFGKGMRRASRRTQERMADLFTLVGEAARGHRVVKAFGMEGFERERFRRASERHLGIRLKAQMLTYASTPVVETVGSLGAAAFFIYAGRQIRAGTLNAAEVVTFIVLAIMLYDPIRKLNKVNLTIQEALACVQRVRELMAEPDAVVECSDARCVTAFTDAVTFADVSFAYETEAVLRNLDLTVRRGEMIALVGRSGAGKSTLVNLLPRFYDPEQGSVLLDGVDLRDLRLADLRALIGIVTQETILFDDTVRNNIAYGRGDLPAVQVEAAARAAYAHEFIVALPKGYDTPIGEAGLKLSGGQRQRLAIARALLKDPPILILDEATSYLDSESEQLVQKALSRLIEGRTALVIAHRLSTVQRADRIVVMDGGRIVEQGTQAALLASSGPYRHLYDLELRAELAR